MPPLKIGEIWNGTLATLRPSFWTLLTVAAPFTLLVDMVVAIFGPEPPKTFAEMTPRLVLMLIVIPGLIGVLAQLAVARLVVAPHEPPRAALAIALAVAPIYVGALLLSAVPVGFGLLLVIPGLYLSARLFVSIPIAVTERLDPIAILQRSWALTSGHGVPILGFMVVAILVVLFASVIVGGVGAALGSVLKIAGIGAIGSFVAALLNAALSTVVTVAGAVAASVIYLRLR